MAIRLLPVFNGFSLDAVDVRVDREGARRLARFVFSGGRSYSWKTRLAARAAGWANRKMGVVSLPFEAQVPIEDPSDDDIALLHAMRDVILDMALPYVPGANGGTTRQDCAQRLEAFFIQVFCANGDPNLRAEIVATGIFDTDTKAFLSNVQLSEDDAAELSAYLMAS